MVDLLSLTQGWLKDSSFLWCIAILLSEMKKCSTFDGVSKDVGNCQIICKPLEPHTRTNKQSAGGVSKNTKNYSTISTKPQDPCPRINKRQKTWFWRNERRLSHTTKINTQKNDSLKLQMWHKPPQT